MRWLAKAAYLTSVRVVLLLSISAKAKTPDKSTIFNSPHLSTPLLTVILRPWYMTLAPTSLDSPWTAVAFTYPVSEARLLLAMLSRQRGNANAGRIRASRGP